MTPAPRVLLLSAGGVVLAAGVLVAVATAASGSTVPRGVHVVGVDLSGDDRATAAAEVRSALASRAARDVALQAGDVRGTLHPASSGLAVDVDAVVDDAIAGDTLDRLRGLLGARRDVAPRSRVDRPALRRSLSAFKTKVDRPAREGTIRFVGTTPVAVPPQTGRALDLDDAVRTVEEQWLDADGALVLNTPTHPVRTTAAGVRTTLADVARPAVAGPVELDVGGRLLEVRPADVAASLSFRVDENGTLQPRLSASKLRASLGARADAFEHPPVDARIEVRDGRPVVVPGQAGTRIDPVRLVAGVQNVLTIPPPRGAAVGLVPAQPALTTQRAQSLGVKEVIGTFTTHFPCCPPRVTNIQRIAALVDGTLVLPGQTYSLNGAVGRRTAERGFVAAPQILDGQFVDDIGGGVSQFATTMYNATYFAGLEEVAHQAHSYYISRYPEGREATVFYPTVDLRWRNDSGHGVLVTTASTSTSVTVTLWGTRRFDVESVTGPRSRVTPFTTQYVDRPDCTASVGAEGFDVTVTRVLKKRGAVIARQPVTTRYDPEPHFVCGSPPG